MHVIVMACCWFGMMAGAADFNSRSVQVDPSFPYYKDRSPESIAAELQANGYGWMRYMVVLDRAADAKLVEACQKTGLAVSYTTLGNGVYNTNDLPSSWQSWRMVYKNPKTVVQGYHYICMNNPEYRRWKKERITATLERIPFDALEIMESFWPAYDGPAHAYYACFCGHCRAAFLRANPGVGGVPEFLDVNSPDYYRTNRELYSKWIEFRAQSVASFLNDLINAPGGVREKFPKVKVLVWGIADNIPNAVATIKEWEGLDGALLVRSVRPDMYVIQTDWPDWTKPDLAPEYVLKYKPFVDAVRAVNPNIPVHVQADNGSNEKCRRGGDWMEKCAAAAREIGVSGVTAYEYHLSRDVYEAPPRPVSASGSNNTITLIFNKRLDAASAVATGNYGAKPGAVVSARVDGNLVKLQVEGQPQTVTAQGVADDPTRRFFKNHPKVVMPGPITLPVQWATATR